MVVRRRFRSKIRILTGDYREKTIHWFSGLRWSQVREVNGSNFFTNPPRVVHAQTPPFPVHEIITCVGRWPHPHYDGHDRAIFHCFFLKILSQCLSRYWLPEMLFKQRRISPVVLFKNKKIVFRDRLSHIIKLHSSSHNKTSICPWIWLRISWVQPRLATSARCDRVELSDYVSTATILLQRKLCQSTETIA